jgi:hypothetical protein
MQLLSPWALCSFAPCCCTGWWALLWTNHRQNVGMLIKCICKQDEVDEEHASCARKECVSYPQGPVSFPCSEIVSLTQDDEEMRTRKVAKEATRKNWVEKFPWIELHGAKPTAQKG